MHPNGCGVGVVAGVGVGRSRPSCLESELELESVKFSRLRLWLEVAGYDYGTSTDNDFVVRRPENIEGQEEREIGSVEIKLKRHLVIEVRLIKAIGYKFRVIATVV